MSIAINSRQRATGRHLAAAMLWLASSTAVAAPFYWTDWQTATSPSSNFTATGTITTSSSTIGVTYTNAQGVGFIQTSGGTDYWSHWAYGGGGRNDAISPYTSTLVDNAPTGTDIIALSKAGSQTLTFTQSIANPVFAYVSLNGNGYAFDQDFEILSQGGVDGNACGYWGCGTVTKNIVDLGGGQFEYQLLGSGEPHGAIRFTGSFSEVSWRSLTNEYWNGFTVGVQGTTVEVTETCATNPRLPGCDAIPVPEPAALLLLLTGLWGGLVLQVRKPWQAEHATGA